MQKFHIGLLGCGNVGSALVELLEEQRRQIAKHADLELRIARIAVSSPTKDRGLDVDPQIFGTDAQAVVIDPNIDLVVELIGGIEPARSLLKSAIAAGKPVVTANKELLANHGAELFAAADEAKVDLLFEAAVAGAIPLMRPLRESLSGEHVHRIMGIVNGTTNYILTRMTDHNTSYDKALREAQKLGYAERDPTADVEGFDAGAKAAIIAAIAFRANVVADDVYHEGISNITPQDIETARRLGYVVKAIAVIERISNDQAKESDPPEIAVRVHPAMLPIQHPLAAVRGGFNAVFVEGDAVGELMFYGRGAGGRPTAGAVLGDIIDTAINLTTGSSARMGRFTQATIQSIDDLRSAYYIMIEVTDRPGVLATVADVFGRNQVSIRSMEQHGFDKDARLMFITHRCRENNLQATLQGLQNLDVVHKLGNVIRVISDEDG